MYSMRQKAGEESRNEAKNIGYSLTDASPTEDS